MRAWSRIKDSRFAISGRDRIENEMIFGLDSESLSHSLSRPFTASKSTELKVIYNFAELSSFLHSGHMRAQSLKIW